MTKQQIKQLRKEQVICEDDIPDKPLRNGTPLSPGQRTTRRLHKHAENASPAVIDRQLRDLMRRAYFERYGYKGLVV